ncbi:cytochrome b/b6 domain-containing protein [Herbiconiux daphne]|uniref:Cytochrome b/b6 domain-containing protein n=1 Tax=Herbiconiux daphne TaxID=2970914 RepID=A0ABT2H3N1_9MICO|nr:cytochrome b/b6 domain-containing protein [Herbiconiux daphne]MCS5734543.1 cytochrome b/b6 domain-containing protein [Herbiconiux daphne]
MSEPPPPVRRGLPRTPTPASAADAPAPPEAPASVKPEVPTAAPAPRRGLPRPTAAAVSAPVGPAPVEPAPVATASSAPTSGAGSPERRTLSRRAIRFLLGGVVIVLLAAAAVLLARWFVGTAGVGDFLARFPGETELPEGAPVGIPAWLAWQHFLNTLLLVLIIRTGWQVRTEKRPAVFYTSRSSRTSRRKISITLWLHQAFDLLWVLNGVVFFVLLLATGQWMRVVPTSWEVFPNALSALLQYVSLDWPTENGWVNYNSLQVLAYFATIFLAAPLAILTGVRMSSLWPAKAPRLNRLYPIEWARAVHFPVMLFFVAFIVVHVALVLATGALRNLNHMYGGQDAVNWVGFGIFAGSLVVIAGLWIAARPVVVAPVASLFGKVGR